MDELLDVVETPRFTAEKERILAEGSQYSELLPDALSDIAWDLEHEPDAGYATDNPVVWMIKYRVYDEMIGFNIYYSFDAKTVYLKLIMKYVKF